MSRDFLPADNPGLIEEIDRRIAADLAEPDPIGPRGARVLTRDRERVAVLLSPTVWRFVHDDRDVVIIYGPRREGKTTGAIARVLRIAATNPAAQPLIVACVRDTWTNLQRTVIQSLKKGMALGWWDVEFRNSETECVLNGGKVHIFFFGMDRPADANKFQSFECGVLWISEPAPAADLASGVPIEVFAVGLTSLSQAGFSGSVQIDMNPPDEDHWTVALIDRLIEMNKPEITVGDHWIEPGENRHVSDAYRKRMRVGLELAGRDDLVERLVLGHVYSPRQGVSVSPKFIEHGPGAHVFVGDIEVNPFWDCFRFWDFGLNPTCVWAQTSPMGHFNILGCVVGENIGIEQLIPEKVLPWQVKYGMVPEARDYNRRRGGARRPWVWRDIGDPAGSQREQSNSERSARKALEAMLTTRFEPGPVAWPARRDSITWVLNQWRGTTRMLQIDPEARALIKALRGDWHYARTSAGVISKIPVKNLASHPGDAFGYGCAKLFPAHEFLAAALRDEEYQAPPVTAQPASWLGR